MSDSDIAHEQFLKYLHSLENKLKHLLQSVSVLLERIPGKPEQGTPKFVNTVNFSVHVDLNYSVQPKNCLDYLSSGAYT